MGQKDITEKILESYNDVFADIVNVLLFGGEEVIKEDELEDRKVRSAYKADGKYREIERDVAKLWHSGEIKIACIGLENQSVADADMPLRVIAYDGAEYRAQLDVKPKKKYPVVTLVLYFGYEEHWHSPLSLSGCFKVPEKLRPFVNDYRINLFEIAYLNEDTVDLFKSDFKAVADYFVQMRKNSIYTGSDKELLHVKETLAMMSAITGDDKFEKLCNENGLREGEVRTMTSALDYYENRGRTEGISIGRNEGISIGRSEGTNEMCMLFQKLMADGRNDDMQRALSDPIVRERLIKEYAIA